MSKKQNEAQRLARACEAEVIETIRRDILMQDVANLLRKQDKLLEQAMDVIKSECGYGGTNQYDPRAVVDAIRSHLEET